MNSWRMAGGSGARTSKVPIAVNQSDPVGQSFDIDHPFSGLRTPEQVSVRNLLKFEASRARAHQSDR
ncbi:hypothetical protein ACVWZZ_006657 [Bradyrhizobium sp. LM6.10]